MHLARFSRSGTKRQRTRGQSLVEFAIVLPIILFLTLIALDFGRVYLGWINLQSMSRIAANLAANNPTAWSGSGDAAVKAKYQNQIRNDAAATNCDLPKVGGVATAAAPTFTDTGGNGSAEDIGDTARVALTCTFHVITPGISNLLGGTVAVSASAVFPVKTGMTDPGAGGGVVGVAPNAAFTGNTAIAPSTLSGPAPFNVVFRDTSGGNPTGWLWNFNDGSPNSTAQDPLDHLFIVPGTYVVTMTASNSYGSSTASMGVTVTAASTVDFTSNKTSGGAPLAVTFNDASTAGGTTYAWTFGTGEGTGTGTTVSHTYNTPGTYTVSLTVTYPVTGAKTTTKTNYISVAVGLCTVPHLDNVKRNNAQATWTAAGFTGTVSDGPGAPNGNYTIKSQSLTATSSVPCSSSVVVNNP
jgi:PKD repeat protein